MSVEEMPTRRRAVRGLPAPRPTPPANADQETPATGQPPPVETPTAPAPTSTASEPRTPAAATPAPPASPADHDRDREPSAPARHERRDPRTFRMYSSLYERLTTLVRELEDAGYRTDRTELLHALLHFELPRDPDSARTLIRRFRHQQLD